MQPLPIVVILRKYATHAISGDSEMATFFARAIRMLISRPSGEHSFHNFLALPLPIFVIWPKYATRPISRDFETTTFF